jgi:hypothetical protein
MPHARLPKAERFRSAVATPGESQRILSIALPNVTLATLEFAAAAIRRESGRAISMSGIIRALISWLAEADIDTGKIRTAGDFAEQMLGRTER